MSLFIVTSKIGDYQTSFSSSKNVFNSVLQKYTYVILNSLQHRERATHPPILGILLYSDEAYVSDVTIHLHTF